MWKNFILVAVLVVLGVAAACAGPAGPAGEPGGDAGPPGRNAYLTGPGLALTIVGVQIASDGVATVTFTIADGAGTPLDLGGLYTEGAVTARFVLARLDADPSGEPEQYAAYTTRQATSPTTGVSETQADADEGGSFAELEPGSGRYTYRFGTVLPTSFDASKTHTVGVWAWRDFKEKRYVANAVYSFVPSGAPVQTTREIVKTQACNACHNPMSHHEGDVARRETALCILCHAAPMRDPDSGNSLDFRVMIHKMHRGKNLPSVAAGGSYQLFSGEHEADDFSGVVFPQPIERCQVCHTGAQGDRWKTRPSRAACGSCHDSTSFVSPPPSGMTLHGGGGAQPDDTKCTTCHAPEGGLKGVADAHLTPALDPVSPVIGLAIRSVDATAPGKTPVVHFAVTKDTAPLDILAAPLTSLAVTVAGPTTDYAQAEPLTFGIQGGTPTGTLAAEPGGYRYTLPSPIPADALGTWAIGMEGYLAPDPKNPASTFAALNPVAFVAVTDAAPVPRRTVVGRARCNNCHYDLSAHGGTRRSPEYCVLCHTPNKVGDQGVARLQVPATVAPSLDLKVLVHKIHMGEKLTQPYVVGGFPVPTIQNPAGTPVNFAETLYPDERRACWACHEGTTYTLPLPPELLPTKLSQTLACADPAPLDPTAWCTTRQVVRETFIGPTAAACTACHDAPSTEAHARVMTTSSGEESCATCHGPGKERDVQQVHAPAP